MRVLFVHPRGAAQFAPLARHLAARGAAVSVLCEAMDGELPGIRFHCHPPPPDQRRGPSPLVFAARYAETGYRAADLIERIAEREGRPDVVIGHIGWGSLLFARDVLPATPLAGYCEYYFRAEGGDLGFAPGETVTAADRRRLRARNMAQLATFEALDLGLSPTDWQRSLYPAWAREKIAVCHEGVDLDFCRPGEAAVTLPNGRTVRNGDPVVTFAARSLEPARGFPQFMRAAAKVAARRSDAIFVAVGGDDISYGARPPGDTTWRAAAMADTGIDPERIVFPGRIDHATLRDLFRLSAAHVYLSTPFVLSWSMLEAMACGALVIGSANPPVDEVIEHGRNGLLVSFFDSDALADTIVAALAAPARFRTLRAAAMSTVRERYDRSACLARQRELVSRLAGSSPRRQTGAGSAA